MTKLFRTLALTALLAGATSAVTVAPAQEKGKPAKKEDDDKKAEKKDAAKKAKKATSGIVQINESAKNGKYYMSIRDAEGKFLAQGGPSGYENKEDALKALEAIKEALESPKVEYNTKKADDKDDDKKDDKKDKKDPKKDKKG